MIAQRGNTDAQVQSGHVNPRDQMRDPEDDWRGIIDQKKRRKLQNRLNQRAYREFYAPSRINGTNMELGLRRKGISLPEENPTSLSQVIPFNGNKEEEEDILKCAHAPPNALAFQRWFEATVRHSYLHGNPQVEHLISLSRLNVHRAINENIKLLGMNSDWMKSDDSVSIFNLLQPVAGNGTGEESIPPSLRPTAIQRTVPHHPWLDFFPFPRMRDLLILACATNSDFDDDELCHDLMAFWDTRNTNATLFVWGSPWDPSNWEVTEAFVRKWGWLLKGSGELFVSTGTWRRKRGEKTLDWGSYIQSADTVNPSI